MPDAHRGKSLIGDDATAPYQISHVTWHRIGIAIHTVKSLVVDASVIHISALFTILRSAMENASTAVWLLARPAATIASCDGFGSRRLVCPTWTSVLR